MFNKVKFKIFTLLALIYIFTFVLIFYFIHINLENERNEVLKTMEINNSNSINSLMKLLIENGMKAEHVELDKQLKNWVSSNKLVNFIIIIDPRYQEVVFYYPDTLRYIINNLYLNKEQFLLDKNTYVSISTCTVDNDTAHLILGFDVSQITANYDQKFNLTSKFLFSLLLVSLFILSISTKIITIPLSRISDLAKKIGSGEKPNIDKIYSIKEIDDLSMSLNYMLSKLEETKLEIINQNEQLIKEINYRKEIEESYLEQKNLLEQIINTAPAVIAFIDKNYVYRLSNNKHAYNLGRSNTEIIGKNLKELFPEDRVNEIIKNFTKAKELKEIVNYYIDIKVDGQIRNYYSTIKSIFGKNNEFLGTILVSVDFTDILENQKKIEISNTILNIQQELSPDGILIIDDKLNVVKVNNRYYDIFDFNRNYEPITNFEDILKKSIPKIKSQSKVVDLKKYIENKQTFAVFDELELTNGKIVVRYLTPMISSNNEYLGLIIYLRDVTNERKMLHELEEALIKAEMANKFKSEFLANMSHEIRTPLNAVIGFSQLLSTKLEDKKLLSYAESINASGKNLLNLINDILDLSKIEAGKLELEFISTNIRYILNEIYKIFIYEIQRKGLEIIINIDKNVPENVIIDEIRLRQILLNIVGNAVKFTDEGYVFINVMAHYNYNDLSNFDLIFEIKDTGIGIPEKDRYKIFDAFYQKSGQSNKKYGGTGLGLAITRKLVNLMNGKIDVEANIPKGSVFTVTFYQLNVASTSSIEENKKINDEFVVNFDKFKLLIVDDIEINRKLIKEFLENYNLDIYEASNGLEAIEILKENDFDIVIMDIKMPIMDGHQAIKVIRKELNLKSLPIIALTASAMIGDRELILSEGFNSYLSKPIDKYKLIKELIYLIPDKVLNLHKLEQSENIEKYKFDTKSNLIDKDIFIEKLNEIKLEVNNLSKSLIIGNIKTFGNKLLDVSEKHRCNDLKIYAIELKEALNNFDIVKIKNLLDNFDKIIEKINISVNENQ